VWGDAVILEDRRPPLLTSCCPCSEDPLHSRIGATAESRRDVVVPPRHLAVTPWPPLHEANHDADFGHWRSKAVVCADDALIHWKFPRPIFEETPVGYTAVVAKGLAGPFNVLPRTKQGSAAQPLTMLFSPFRRFPSLFAPAQPTMQYMPETSRLSCPVMSWSIRIRRVV
jgi:hypothetical protein